MKKTCIISGGKINFERRNTFFKKGTKFSTQTQIL